MNLLLQSDLSSDELPQGLVGLVHYCNGAVLSTGTTMFLPAQNSTKTETPPP